MQRRILETIQRSRRTSVRSGHARGKDYVAAVASLCFLYLNVPSKVIETAPCYDDKTEILTNDGWKYFKDLDKNDLVAQRGEDNYIEFVKPLEYFKFPYSGEMICCRNQLIDFVVTPNHKCLFDKILNVNVRRALEIKNYDEKMRKKFGSQPIGKKLSEDKKKNGWSQRRTAEEFKTSTPYVTNAVRIAKRVEKLNNKYNKYELFEGTLKEAKSIYSKTGRFCKIAHWKGTKADNDWMEFMGFWFAEGYAQYNEKQRRYRVTITQKKEEEYTDDLLLRNKRNFRNEWHKYKKQFDNGYNWELYQKDMAREFVKYGKARTKWIPDYIKNADMQGIKAFLYGFLKGDGSIDKNGSIKLCTSSKSLADDLHELCVKAGYISNRRIYYTKQTKIKTNKKGRLIHTIIPGRLRICYEIKMWSRRGKYPAVNSSHWYKEYYEGFVYCVKVPSGVVMVRRDRKNHWSSNTQRQVIDIMMSEITKIHLNAKIPLGGELLTHKIIFRGDPDWFLEGFKTKDKKVEDWTGYHSPNLMVVITEASGIEQETFDAIEGLITGNSRLVLIFNPNRTSGEAYRSTTSPLYEKYEMNCLNAVNVRAKKILIPGQVDYEWINEKIRKPGWVIEVDEDDVRKDLQDFKWNGRWYRPSNLFLVKVMGKFPRESEDTLIPLSWIELANERWQKLEGKGKGSLRLGVDVAGMGRDLTVRAFRRGNVIEEFKVNSRQDLMVTVGKVKNDLTGRGDVAYVDALGEGSGVYSRLAEQEVNVVCVKYSFSAKDLTDITGQRTFANMRAYIYWAIRDALDPSFGGDLALPPIDELTQDLTETHFKTRSNGDIIIEEKDDIKKRLKRSPDYGDSVANTFFPEEVEPEFFKYMDFGGRKEKEEIEEEEEEITGREKKFRRLEEDEDD
jgi:hypothetical protein